jgi:phenylacetate-CoA ligase
MIDKLYGCCPVFIQNVICSVYGYIEKGKRFSNRFFVQLESLKKSDFFSKNEIIQHQEFKLGASLNNAADNSDYYKDLNEIMIKNKDQPFRSIIKNLPILSKVDIQRSSVSLKCNTNEKVHTFKTSGTSGKALNFYKSSDAIVEQWAIWFRHRARFGVELGDVHVNFTGKPVVPLSQEKPPFWRYNRAIKQYLIPMQVVTKGNIEHIVNFLNSINPKFYSGYPSIISEVCRLALASKLVLKPEAAPDFIFTGAEPVLDKQRVDIETWSYGLVSDQYGMTEGVCNISKCPEGNYHEDFEFGFIERVDKEILPDGAIKAKIVATSFSNYAFPFIRYDTGDVAIWEPDDYSCSCGRNSRVIRSIEGRLEDYILTPEGRRIMRFDYVFKDSTEIKEAQVVQRLDGSIVINYVLNGQDKLDEQQIIEYIKKYISSELDISFLEVSSIAREANGKFRSVKSLMVKYETNSPKHS